MRHSQTYSQYWHQAPGVREDPSIALAHDTHSCLSSPLPCRSVLEDASCPSDAASQFSTLYTQHKDVLRQGAASASAAAVSLPSLGSLSSTVVPSIVDVSWRLDDYLKSDSMDQVRQPVYLVTLTTTTPAQANGAASGPATRPVPFECNLQQLQDLLAKLKDAQKQIQQRVE